MLTSFTSEEAMLDAILAGASGSLSVIEPALADDAEAVVREAASNAVRHGKASDTQQCARPHGADESRKSLIRGLVCADIPAR
jgi:hypothetical protein